MSNHIDQTIAELQKKLKAQEDEVAKTKQLINLLCSHTGRPPIYSDTELGANSTSYSFSSDEFYGHPLATNIKSILRKRKLANLGPATPREIYDALVEGGYAFDTDNEANRLIGVRVSLRKGSSVFHRLPDGKRYGLLEWYPKAKKVKNKDDNDPGSPEDDVTDTDEVPEEDESADIAEKSDDESFI